MDCMDRTQKTVYLDDDQIDRLEGSAEENDSSFNEEVRKALDFAFHWYNEIGGDTATSIAEIYAIQKEMERHSETMTDLNQRMTDLVNELPEEKQEKFEKSDSGVDWMSSEIDDL